MRMIHSTKNYQVSDALLERMEKKVSKLSRYFHPDVEAHVRFSQERGNRYVVEITIPFGGGVLRGEAVTDDMFMSLDDALERIERQIFKHRTRIEKRLRDQAFEPATYEFVAPATTVEPDSGTIVRVKRVELSPISTEDAILQMDMLGHSFFAYQDIRSGLSCVVYRRHDGNYGVLELEGK